MKKLKTSTKNDGDGVGQGDPPIAAWVSSSGKLCSASSIALAVLTVRSFGSLAHDTQANDDGGGSVLKPRAAVGRNGGGAADFKPRVEVGRRGG